MTMYTNALLTALLLTGCGQEQDKTTSLPAPQSSQLTVLLAPGDGIEARSLNISGGHLLLEGCAPGTGASLFLSEGTNLAGLDTSLLGGNWCGLSLSLSEPAELQSITHGGQWLQAPVGGAHIVLGSATGVSVDGQAFILELGSPGWIEVGLLTDASTDQTLETGSAELDQVLRALSQGSTLFEDLDGNGVLGTDERAAVRARYIPEDGDDETPQDTGAQDTGAQDTGAHDTGAPER